MAQSTTDMVDAGLNMPGFGISGGVASTSTDPIIKIQVMQDILELDFYDLNPRKQENEKYQEIKQSIRQTKGPDTPLAVTRRPDAANRMVFSGGNTRLRALKELYQELSNSNDSLEREEAKTLRHILCVFHPWESESRTHLAHLMENDQRSPLTLLDKAQGIKTQWLLWQEEREENLSQATFIRLLKDAGYTISQANVSRFIYVTDTLLQYIPQALQGNVLGNRDIDELRKTKNAYVKIWIERDNNTEDSLEPVFLEALGECDGENFSIEALKKYLDKALAVLLDEPLLQIRQGVDAKLTKPGKLANELTTTDVETNIAANTKDTPTTETNPVSFKAEETEPVSISAPKGNINAIRASNLTLALTLAENYQLEEFVSPISAGMGFALDMPAGPLLGEKQQWAWWLLLSLSEQDQPSHLAYLDECNMFRMMRDERQDDDIQVLVGKVELADFSRQFLADSDFNDSGFDALVTLMRNCRNLHKLTTAKEVSLWA